MPVYRKSGSSWISIKNIYRKVSSSWIEVKSVYRKVGSSWIRVFFQTISNSPSIAQAVTLVTSSSTMPATLTGRNYRWTNATVLTYKFQYYNEPQWLDGNGSNATGTITNPSVGSSNTRTYTPILGDFPSSSATSTAQFRFVVTATNTNVSPSLQTVSTSNTVSVENVINVNPVIPTISMAGNSGVSQIAGTINWTSTNQASFSSTGTFSGTGTTATSISKTGLTAGTTYTGTVTVTSSTGNTASANYSIKTADANVPVVNTVAPSLTVAANSTNMTVTSGSWSGSPSIYRYRWYQLEPMITAPIRNVLKTDTSDSFGGNYEYEYIVNVTATNQSNNETANIDSNYLYVNPSAPSCTAEYLPYGDWEYKDSNGNDTSWSSCVSNSQTRGKRRARYYQNADCSTSGPYYEYGTDTQSCTVTCTAGCGSYGDIVYGTYTSCVNCSKSRTRSQTRTCTNTDCTTYPDTLTLTPESTSCSCTAFTGAYGEYTAWSAYGSCTAVGCLAVKFRSRTRTRNVGDACCNITTQTQTQEESAYCNVTRYTCSNFDVTNVNSVNYYDCFSVGACTAKQDPACVRTACQFS